MTVDDLNQLGAKGAQRLPRELTDHARKSCGRLRGWHVIETAPGKPFVAELAIAAQGWDVLHPLHLLRTTRHPDRIVPLFPGYLFVLFSEEDDWPRICRANAVHRILGPPGKPATVPTAAITDLQARMSDRRIVDDPLTAPPYAPGTRLAVRAGPLAGWSGICKLAAAERVTVLLSMLGREVEVVLSPAAVMPG